MGLEKEFLFISLRQIPLCWRWCLLFAAFPGCDEDRPRRGSVRVPSAAEDKFIGVTSLRNLHQHLGLEPRQMPCRLPLDTSQLLFLVSSKMLETEKMSGWFLHVWLPLWSMKEEVWCRLNGDTVGDLLKSEGVPNQHGYHSILHLVWAELSPSPPPGWGRAVGPSRSDGVLCQMSWPPHHLT